MGTEPAGDLVGVLSRIHRRNVAKDRVGGEGVQDGKVSLASVVVEEVAASRVLEQPLRPPDDVGHERGEHARDDEVRHAHPEQLVAAVGLLLASLGRQ